jgi:hypothetical protein
MTNEQLHDLIDEYVSLTVDCMDMGDLINHAYESIYARLEQMGTEDILAEITELAPELLTDDMESGTLEQ